MKKFMQNFTKDITKAYKEVFQKQFRKTFYLVKLFLFFTMMLCSCNMQKDVKEKEIVMQLEEKEDNVSQQRIREAQKEKINDDSNGSFEEDKNKNQNEISSELTGSIAESVVNSEPSNDIYVYVCGAVNCPGVYQTTEGSRLFEVVELAGGLSAEADETCLNLARIAEDGEQLVILTKKETAALAERGLYNVGATGGRSTESAVAKETAAQGSGLVNINTATISELITVSGIGESRAQAIIAYREVNGCFQTIEDIKKVDGIKDGLFSKIKDKITV